MSKNMQKAHSAIFQNDHCGVTMTHFRRKWTPDIVRIYMYETNLHFELKKMMRRKPRYGKLHFSFRTKVPLHLGSYMLSEKVFMGQILTILDVTYNVRY